MFATMRSQLTLTGVLRPVVCLLSVSDLSLLCCDTTSAVTFTFSNITNNDPNSAAIGESQLAVDVFNGGGTVKFKFTNAGPEDSAISQIYFDDGSLLGISSVINGAGVDFAEDASPSELPGANLAVPVFETTAGFLASANPSPSMNGVGPGEEVTIVYDLQGAQTVGDVLDELEAGTLRIGIHVIAFANGESESYVNDPTPEPIVPEPSSIVLLLTGLFACGRTRCRL